jgi:uncharacterized protein
MRRIPGIVVIAAAAALWMAGPASAQVVISEFRTRGPEGGNDEFVEIRNTGSPVDISGWLLQGCASGTPGNPSTRTTVPADVTLANGQSYLFANTAAAGYSGTVAPDRTYGTGFTDFAAGNFAGIRIVNIGGTVIDGVGSAQSPCHEGTGITTPGANGDNSFERRNGTADSDNNLVDFQGPKPGNPQNFAGEGGPGDAAPSVAGSDPANFANNVDRNTNIRITFSEPVTALDSAFTLTCGDSAVALTVTRESDTVYALDPQSVLPLGASCTVRVEGDDYTDTDTDDPPDTGTDFSATFSTTGIEGLRIHDIQGRAHLSPYRDSIVAGVPGVVTARRFNGFFIQDPTPDRDERTSEGIFVFTGSPVPAAAAVGNAVTVSGRVTEFRSGCTPTCDPPDFPAGDFGASAYANLTLTELDRATVTVTGTGTIKPTLLGRGGRDIPDKVIDDDTPDPESDEPPLITGNVEDGSPFDPREDGIDFYESLEGMLTQVNKAVVVEPTNVFSAGAANENAELAVLADGGKDASVLSDRGVIVARSFDLFPPRDYRRGDFNPERIILNDPVARDNDVGELPEAQVGDRFDKPVISVVDYSFGNYKFLVREVPPIVRGKLTPEKAKAAGKDELSIASYNVENLDPVNDAARIVDIARQIRENLRAPDILGLQEVQDNDGETSSGNAQGDATWTAIIAAIAAQGGPVYQFRQIDPVYNQDGGAPGANIRVGFLFNPARVQFVDRPGGTATTATEDDPAQRGAQLTFSPGRIEPNDPAWEASRKPLAGEFRYRGKTLFVVANHFASKGGDAPLFGRFQEPYRPSEIQRRKQAEIVNGWVKRIQKADPLAKVVVLGDLNDFEFSESVRILQQGTRWSLLPELVDLWHLVRSDERYSYIFQGNGQVLDHILVTPILLLARPEFGPVHMNSEFDTEQQSDHDPPLLRLTIR